MQAASTEAFQPSTPGVPEPVSRTLHIQVAKVVTAHAASVGDMLLGVPLLCSAGKVHMLDKLCLTPDPLPSGPRCDMLMEANSM